MSEIISNEVDENPENLPSQESIEVFFQKFPGVQSYTITKNESDDRGISCFEIEVIDNGLKTEYNYQRASYDYTNQSVPSGARYLASIHSIIYDEDGNITGGKRVANFCDGVWLLNPKL